MLLSLNWIKEFVDINYNPKKDDLDKVVVGFVESLEKHPNADKLNVAQVSVGKHTYQIICGGVNLKEKMYVPVALPGAILPGNFQIKKAEIRGVESSGMICAEEEIGLGESKEKHIMVLDDKHEPGTPLADTLGLEGHSLNELASLLTLRTAEVEHIYRTDKYLEKVVTGKLVEFEKIPNKEKYHKATFDIGSKKITLVFGSVFKLEMGWILPIATDGAVLPGGAIKSTEVHGVMSEGMVCSDEEMGISNSETGLTVFPEGTELGKPVAEILEINDVVIDIDNKTLTHRPDLWSHYGFAREFSVIFNQELKPYEVNVEIPSSGEDFPIEIEEPSICSRYTGLIIENIEVKESPGWLKSKLKTSGHSCINNIVDVTTYVMSEMGQPMHAFDYGKLEGGIIVRFAKEGEEVLTLDEEKRKLEKDALVIADQQKSIAIAGVMGGYNSMITEGTTKILLESANFDPVSVRKTATKIGLRTDAVQRFEKSLDPHQTELAIRKAAELILKVCPNAKIISPILDKYESLPDPVHVNVNIDAVSSKIGEEVSEEQVVDILKKLEFKLTKKDDKNYEVEVPTFRATKDVSIQEDLVEEIARIYGYENVEPKLPELHTRIPYENYPRAQRRNARNLMSALGYDEVYNYSFYGLEDIKNSNTEEAGHIKVRNALSEDQTHMRISLIPNLLKVVVENLKNLKKFKLFELGHTYHDNQNDYPTEITNIVGISVSEKDHLNNFLEAKGALTKILEKFGFKNLEVKTIENLPYAHPKQAAILEHPEIGEIAQIYNLHPMIAQNYKISAKVAIFEINFSKVIEHKQKSDEYKEIPKFPPVKFDVSVIFDRETQYQKVKQAIESVDPELIHAVELFDIYEGPNIDEGKKAFAFSIELLSREKTLKDKHMVATQQAVFQKLEEIGGKVRKA